MHILSLEISDIYQKFASKLYRKNHESTTSLETQTLRIFVIFLYSKYVTLNKICILAHISCLISTKYFSVICKQIADAWMKYSVSNKMSISTKLELCKEFRKFQWFLLENWHYFWRVCDWTPCKYDKNTPNWIM